MTEQPSLDSEAIVTKVLIDSLGIDPEEVLPSAKISEDLGGDSHDNIDIVFRLEKATGLELSRAEFSENLYDRSWIDGVSRESWLKLVENNNRKFSGTAPGTVQRLVKVIESKIAEGVKSRSSVDQ